MIRADITPDTSLIQSWANQLIHWSTILGELIDNAFDAGATRIRLTLGKDRLRIEDNGVGCPDRARMLTAGKHTRHESTRLGRCGRGAAQPSPLCTASLLLRVLKLG
jgi:sensor histidine kinase regulating citrate/malate metabolism